MKTALGPPNFGFHHGGVSVPDLDAAIAWYADMLGFAVEARFTLPGGGAQVAMMVRDAVRMELFEVSGADPLPMERRDPQSDLMTHGNKHVAFAVTNIDAFLSYAKNNDADIALVVREDFGSGCFLRDCAGNLIEIVEAPAQRRATVGS